MFGVRTLSDSWTSSKVRTVLWAHAQTILVTGTPSQVSERSGRPKGDKTSVSAKPLAAAVSAKSWCNSSNVLLPAEHPATLSACTPHTCIVLSMVERYTLPPLGHRACEATFLLRASGGDVYNLGAYMQPGVYTSLPLAPRGNSASESLSPSSGSVNFSGPDHVRRPGEECVRPWLQNWCCLRPKR